MEGAGGYKMRKKSVRRVLRVQRIRNMVIRNALLPRGLRLRD